MRDLCRLFFLAIVLVLALAPRASQAHVQDTASLSLREVEPGRFAVRFQAGSPTLQQQLTEPARYPKSCTLRGPELECGPGGLAGRLEFPWLEGTLTHLLVDIEWQDGTQLMRVVTASSPGISVYGSSSSAWMSWKAVLADYTWLGVEHIVGGFDHLFFVIALTFLVTRRRALVATVTAFTLAHSLTLAATSLGWFELSSAPVEAMIALSIVLVCAETLRPGASLTRQAPWLVAFSFGLLHGLGFASALMEIGLPERHLPSALFSFNLGVELGQLGVIALVLVLRALAERWTRSRPELERALLYSMGGLAAYWWWERLGAVFSG